MTTTETETTTTPTIQKGYVGQNVPRKEDKRLVQGQGVFFDDVKRHGMGYVHFVRSPYAHAKIISIDVAKALELEGVYGTITGDEVMYTPDAKVVCPGCFDTADVADQLQQATGPFDLCGISCGARRGRETGLLHHAAQTLGELDTQSSGLARGLHKRDAGTRRSRSSERRIRAGRNRDAGCCKTQYQPINLLAANIPRAFAQGVTDIAEHEQVA